VSSRAKDLDSLKEKAEKMADILSRQHFIPSKPIIDDSAMDLLDDNILDLAGIRILVYFHDHAPKVVEAIEKLPDLHILDSKVSFTKSHVDHRQEDSSELSRWILRR